MCLIKDEELFNKEIIKRTELISDEINQANELDSEFPTTVKIIKKEKRIIPKMRLLYGNRKFYD